VGEKIARVQGERDDPLEKILEHWLVGNEDLAHLFNKLVPELGHALAQVLLLLVLGHERVVARRVLLFFF